MDNFKTLEHGFIKGKQIMEDYLVNSLISSVQEMLRELPMLIGFVGFTGNTQTSYMAGVYIRGMLRYIVKEKEWTANPVRGKIPYKSTVFLENPYEGRPRLRHGYVRIRDFSGSSLSQKFLQSYKAPKKGLAIVVTTGTEYSEFLEQMFNLNVLTATFQRAPTILNKNWKKIP